MQWQNQNTSLVLGSNPLTQLKYLKSTKILSSSNINEMKHKISPDREVADVIFPTAWFPLLTSG